MWLGLRGVDVGCRWVHSECGEINHETHERNEKEKGMTLNDQLCFFPLFFVPFVCFVVKKVF